MYQWQQMTPFGTWTTVTAPEPPDVRDGRIRRAEGQGPRVKDVRPVTPTSDEPPPQHTA